MNTSPESQIPYAPRIADGELRERLESSGAVLIEGPRAVGKTRTARQLAASEALLDVDDYYREAAQVEPALVLAGPTPRLIDEWQLEPALWNRIRREIDERGTPGQFILTGSATPPDSVTRHTGAGRITRMRMRPMSLLEQGTSTGAISLGSLLRGEPQSSGDTGLELTGLIEAMLAGGWPTVRALTPEQARRAARDYLTEIARLDLGELLDEPRHDPDRLARLMRSLARNVATDVGATTLARDTAGEREAPLDDDTVRSYLRALERVMVVEDQPAWGPHLRSRYGLRKAPKRHFADASLAAAALRATPEGLLRDLQLLGHLFESMVIRDLRAYAQACDATVLHYRDSSGLEADAIVEAADGTWAAFEVKLGPGQVDDAAANLLRLNDRIDTRSCGEPAALGVIVARGLGYRRSDGVQIVPIGALGP